MHLSSKSNAELFKKTYCSDLSKLKIIEIGSQVIENQDSLRDIFVGSSNYIGVDMVEGKGVDIFVKDPYKLPFEENIADVVLASSVLEHSEFFWLLFSEMARICRKGGYIYINAPSNGFVHRYPVDCWRFYPDSGKALEKWAKKDGHDVYLIESFISNQQNEYWNDFVSIFRKGSLEIIELEGLNYHQKITDYFEDCKNIRTNDCEDLKSFARCPEDIARRERVIRNVSSNYKFKY